jgi:H/ACA ribonucleoprotein complex subunit 2
MAKDKSEKKKKRVSDVVPAAVEEDVEMAESKVSNDSGFRQSEVMQDQLKSVKSPKKEKEEIEIVISVEDLSPIAHPLAQKKLLKKLQKTIKKGQIPL